MDKDWISGAAAAQIIGVSKSTVYRSLAAPETRDRVWGAEHDGWRRKPLSTRGVYQIDRATALRVARETG